jgi:hypothetical protein
VPPKLTWRPDAGPPVACNSAVADGHGDVGIVWCTDHCDSSYILSDGSPGASILQGWSKPPIGEDIAAIFPRKSGFLLLSGTPSPWCHFVRVLPPDASPGASVSIDAPPPDWVWQIVPSPVGGYVEVRTTSNGAQPPGVLPTKTLDLRFVDDGLMALGDWHTAVVYHQEISFDVEIDQLGHALAVALLYPPGFGRPADPSTWKFTARWMAIDGPLTSEFEPVAPIFSANSASGYTLFPGWGAFLPLIDGGFAMFQYQSDPRSGGSISPTGWYAFYPSGKAGWEVPPGWLQLYDGSLQALADGRGYAAVDQEPNTCARTVLLVAPSGSTCYRLPLDDNEMCGVYPVIWPDGTLVLQGGCVVRWWPGLVRAHK